LTKAARPFWRNENRFFRGNSRWAILTHVAKKGFKDSRGRGLKGSSERRGSY
jgi:hypothetical protein